MNKIQTSLFEEPKEEKKEKDFDKDEELEEIVKPEYIEKDDSNIRHEVKKFIEGCNSNNDLYYYVIVEWEMNRKKNDKYLSITRTSLMSNKKEYSMQYGELSSYKDKDGRILTRKMDITHVFSDEMKEKIQSFKIPYHKEIEHYGIRNVLMKNWMMFITPRATNHIELYSKIRVDKYLIAFNFERENYATEDYIILVKELIKLENEHKSINDYEGKLWNIEEAVRFLFNLGGRYGSEKPKMPIEFSNCTPNELLELQKRYYNRKVELEKLIKGKESILFRKIF